MSLQFGPSDESSAPRSEDKQPSHADSEASESLNSAQCPSEKFLEHTALAHIRAENYLAQIAVVSSRMVQHFLDFCACPPGDEDLPDLLHARAEELQSEIRSCVEQAERIYGVLKQAVLDEESELVTKLSEVEVLPNLDDFLLVLSSINCFFEGGIALIKEQQGWQYSVESNQSVEEEFLEGVQELQADVRHIAIGSFLGIEDVNLLTFVEELAASLNVDIHINSATRRALISPDLLRAVCTKVVGVFSLAHEEVRRELTQELVVNRAILELETSWDEDEQLKELVEHAFIKNSRPIIQLKDSAILLQVQTEPELLRLWEQKSRLWHALSGFAAEGEEFGQLIELGSNSGFCLSMGVDKTNSVIEVRIDLLNVSSSINSADVNATHETSALIDCSEGLMGEESAEDPVTSELEQEVEALDSDESDLILPIHRREGRDEILSVSFPVGVLSNYPARQQLGQTLDDIEDLLSDFPLLSEVRISSINYERDIVEQFASHEILVSLAAPQLEGEMFFRRGALLKLDSPLPWNISGSPEMMRFLDINEQTSSLIISAQSLASKRVHAALRQLYNSHEMVSLRLFAIKDNLDEYILPGSGPEFDALIVEELVRVADLLATGERLKISCEIVRPPNYTQGRFEFDDFMPVAKFYKADGTLIARAVYDPDLQVMNFKRIHQPLLRESFREFWGVFERFDKDEQVDLSELQDQLKHNRSMSIEIPLPYLEALLEARRAPEMRKSIAFDPYRVWASMLSAPYTTVRFSGKALVVEIEE